MINNRQVNLWRGSDPPPTIYHIWVKDNKMLLYDGNEWITFVDDVTTIERINALIDRVENIENYTINGKLIKNNPVLSGNDIKSEANGNYINSQQKIKDSLSAIDSILTTQTIE